jgi:hypothetical protein
MSTCKIWQSLDIRKVTNLSFKYRVFENLGKFELGLGPLVSHGCRLTGHYVRTHDHIAMARPPPATSRRRCRPTAATCRLRARLTPLPLSLPLLSRAKQTPQSPSRSTTASAPCATAVSPASRHAERPCHHWEAIHVCLLHLHERCHTQAAVHHKPRPKHVIVVRLYRLLSDGRPPSTLVSPPQELPHVHEAPRSSSRRPPPHLRPTAGGAPPPSCAVMEELPRLAPSSLNPSNRFIESPLTSSHRRRPPGHRPPPRAMGNASPVSPVG